MDPMTKRWRKLGWFGPSRRQLDHAYLYVRRALGLESNKQATVRAVRENRLRYATPEQRAEMDAWWDALVERLENTPKEHHTQEERNAIADEFFGDGSIDDGAT
jgi:hypothetical protein